MTKPTPTPGPWNVDPSYPGDVCAGTGHDVAVTCYKGMKPIDLDGTEATIGPQSREEAEANARLIAAAPDLLTVLTNGAQLNMPDFLEWIAVRLVNVHGDDPNIDFVQTLRHRAKLCREAIAAATGATP